MGPQDPRIGTVLGERYRITERLAEGAMGVVYRAERIGLERPVAVKFLHGSIADKKEFVARFEREAKAMSKLAHPHCVPVIDYGVEDTPYIVMELASGRTLADLLETQPGPLPAARAITIVRQILLALAHAHELGIIHRDIKPSNVSLDDVPGAGDHARLLDFGLAKLQEAGADASWSTASLAVGTPSYMSPEQARGETVDARTDLYSTGVVLFQALTGKKPFVGGSAVETLMLHKSQPAPPLGPEYSAELNKVVARALAKQPSERYAGALWMARALAETPEGTGVGAPIAIAAQSSTPRPDEASPVRREPAAERSRRRGGRGRGKLVLGLLLLGAAGAAAVVRYVRNTGHVPPTQPAAGLGVVADAAPVDAGKPDAGRPDAGKPDAGKPDAAPPPPPDATAAPPPPPDAAPVLTDAGERKD